MYFGGTIMTFALPYGAFIVSAVVLFYLFRSRHAGPKLKYLAGAFTTSLGTREPGPVPAPPVTSAPVHPTSVPPAAPVAAPEEAAPSEPESDPDTPDSDAGAE
jgi:hypothetical protein